MGSPVSPIVVHLYMEYFEHKALGTATHPLECGLGICMAHFFIQKEDHKQNFLEHINSVDPAIKFTVEDKEDGAIPFLETIVKPEADDRLFITVYRKLTHMDQYLQWDSHHYLSTKHSVINTLTGPKQFVINLIFLKKNGSSQEGIHSLQVSKMGLRQGRKKAY